MDGRQLNMRRRFGSAISALLMVLWLVASIKDACAQTRATEPELKAAIIANMLIFIEWPAQSSIAADQLHVCYLDNSPVAEALSRIEGRTIRNKALKVTKVTSERMSGCHVIYLSPANRATLPAIIDTLHTSPVMLVSDSPDYFRKGVMLNLDLTSGHVVFDVDLRSVRKAGLQISSKALRLARQVIE